MAPDTGFHHIRQPVPQGRGRLNQDYVYVGKTNNAEVKLSRTWSAETRATGLRWRWRIGRGAIGVAQAKAVPGANFLLERANRKRFKANFLFANPTFC